MLNDRWFETWFKSEIRRRARQMEKKRDKMKHIRLYWLALCWMCDYLCTDDMPRGMYKASIRGKLSALFQMKDDTRRKRSPAETIRFGQILFEMESHRVKIL